MNQFVITNQCFGLKEVSFLSYNDQIMVRLCASTRLLEIIEYSFYETKECRLTCPVNTVHSGRNPPRNYF